MPQSPSVWDEADALLGQPPATSIPTAPSVWEEADRLLATTPAPRRPPPFQVGGVTDPASVKITPPPPPTDVVGAVAAAPKPRVPLRWGALGPQTEPPAPETVATWNPGAGIKQAIDGISAFAKRVPGNVRRALSLDPTAWGVDDASANAISDVLEGTFETVKPLALVGGVTAPIETAAALAGSVAASKAAAAAVRKAGGSDAHARLAGNVAAAVAGGVSTKEILDTLGETAGKVGEAAKTAGAKVTLASKLSMPGFGTGDVPAFRGNPVTDEISMSAEQPPSARSLALDEQLRGAPADAATPDVWTEADALLKAPPAPELVPPGAEDVYNAEHPAPPAPDVRSIAAAGTATLSDDTRKQIDALLREEPGDAVQKPEADAGRVRGLPGAVDETPGEAVGTGNAAPIVAAGARGTAESAAAVEPAPGDRPAAEAVAAEPVRPPLDTAAPAEALPPDVAATLEALAPAPPTSATVEGAAHEETAAPAAGAIPIGGADERPAVAGRGVESPGVDTAGAGAAGSEAPRPDVARAERLARRRADRADYQAAVDEDHRQLIADAVDKAVAEGFTGEPAHLHREIHDRVQLVRELDQEFAQSDRNPQRLLREVARLGGISRKAEAGGTRGLERRAGLQSELEWLQSFRDNNLGQVAGVHGVFNEKRGRSLDDLITSLRQAGEFSHIESPSDLIEEIAAAAREGRPDDDATGDHALGRALDSLGPRWWARIGRAPDVHGEASDAAEPAADELDAAAFAFDPAELEAQGMNAEGDRIRPATEKADVLDTGEQQPRLPDAGAVRDAEHATPEFDAPFSLSGEAADHGARQDTLFAPEKPTFGKKPRAGGSGAMVIPGKPKVPVAAVHGAETMAVADLVKLLIEDLEQYVKEDRPGSFAPLLEDIRHHGIKTPITVEAHPTTGEPLVIVDGRHRLRAAQLLGIERVPVQRGKAPTFKDIREKLKNKSGTTLHSEVVPGADKFVERDVIPHVKKLADELLKMRADVHAVWAPDTVSPAAETQAALMRAELGARRQRTARAQKMMRALEKAWDKIPRGTKADQPSAGTQFAFAMAVDEGQVDELPEWQRGAAKLFKEINDKKRDEIVAWKGLRNWLEHYYPREWVKPGKVAEFVRRAAFGKRPLQGRASFRKARARDEAGAIIPFRAYLQAGYTPVEPNPVRAHLRKWMEMDKWLAARKILERGKRYGTAEFVPIGKEKPEGYDFYDESFGTVYGPPTVQVHEAYDALLMQGLNDLIDSLDVTHERSVRIGGGAWGLAYSDRRIKTKFGGAETVLEHELGHILDERYDLRKSIIDVKDKRFRQELRDLADLREEGIPAKSLPTSRLRYLRKGQEKIANLVHAFLYNPERAKEVAPNSYWALYNLAKDTPELRPLLQLQNTKSLKLESATADVRIHGLPPVIGRYAGPPDAVRLLNRALSPGLRGYKAFNLYRGAGNVLNQVQLGLSGFHLVGTALNAGISHGAIALEHGTRGNWKDAATHAALSTLGPLASLRDVVVGNRLLRDYYAKDADFRSLVDVADGVARGGGAVTWDTFWHQSAPERFLQALRSVGAEAKAGNYPGAAARAAVLPWRALTAVIEAQAKPIMEWWVPRLKLAAYWDLYRMELADLGEIPDELELQKAAGRAWRSVDNRFGELVYDNLFWHAALKDAGMATVRSLGWNVGTIDEVFGALPAQARQLGALPAAGGGGFEPPKRLRHTGFKVDEATGERMPVYEQGRAPALTHKFAYVVALAFYSALFGALYQYFHTGLTPGEQEDGSHELSTALLDLYFPRTGGVTFDGRPERASLPTYVKDVYAFLRHPIDTTRGKLHPLLALASDIIANADYFGNALRDPQAPWLKQIADTFDYAAHEYRPISVSSYVERQKNRKGGAISLAESFLGINVAPASVTRTALENYLRELQPPRTRTKEEADRATAKRSVRELIAEGKKPEAKQVARDAGLTGRGVQQMARAQRLSSVQRAFQATSLSDAIRGYELATPEERKQIKRILERKAANAQSIPAAQREDVRRRLRDALTLPTGN